MNTSLYRIIYITAKRQNMTHAAEELYLTPSAVSHAITTLEKQVNFPLFIREKRNLIPTTYCKELLPQIENLLMLDGKIEKELNAFSKLEKGTVHLGTINSICCTWLPDILLLVKQHSPHIRLIIHQLSYRENTQQLRNGTLDIAFVHMPITPRLTCHYSYRDDMICIAPLTEQFQQATPLPLEEIRDHELILSPDGYVNDIMPFFDTHEAHVQSPHILNDDSSIISLVESGAGISILPRLVLEAVPGAYQQLKIAGNPYRKIGIATQPIEFVTPATRIVLGIIINWMKKNERKTSL